MRETDGCRRVCTFFCVQVIVWGPCSPECSENSAEIKPCSSVLDVGDSATAVAFCPVLCSDNRYILIQLDLDSCAILLYWLARRHFDKTVPQSGRKDHFVVKMPLTIHKSLTEPAFLFTCRTVTTTLGGTSSRSAPTPHSENHSQKIHVWGIFLSHGFLHWLLGKFLFFSTFLSLYLL